MMNGVEEDKKPKAKPSLYSSKSTFIPSILRGHKDQRNKSSEDKSKQPIDKNQNIIEIPNEQSNAELAISLMQNNKKEFADLFKQAEEFLKAHPLKVNFKQEKPANKIRAQDYPQAVKESRLFCNETLDDNFDTPATLPAVKTAPPIIISPFSKAKAKARGVGVSLEENCRGVYDDQELNRRIDFLAKLKR